MKGILDRAIRELREETALEVDGAITRQRIEAGWLHRRARARLLRRTTTMTALAVLMGGGAWAANMYVRSRPNAPLNAGSPPVERPPMAGRSRSPAPSTSNASPAPSPQLPSVPAAPPSQSSRSPAASEAPVTKRAPGPGGRPARLAADARAAVAEADSQPPPTDAATTAYAAAHQAHFVDRDWPRALDFWSRYLALAPTGPLAPEAHFNRAVCLLRLGRHLDAASELEPFAAGQWRGYRQREAAQLLAAMPKL